ncbi:MAG: hypothetical protein QW803_11240 [Candidatus Methanomethylicia archaeon]
MKDLKQNIITHTVSLGTIYILILLYLREIIFSDGIPGSNVNLDFYTHSIISKSYVDALKHGIIPLCTYWYPKIYGGTPVTIYQGGFEIVDALYTLILSLTSNITTTIKSLIFLSLVLAGTTSYLYFKQIFNREGGYAVLSATIYTFSCYWLNEILNGHLYLILGAAFIPLVLMFFEIMILNPSRRNIIALGVIISIIVLLELQITFFTLMFMMLRLIYLIYMGQSDRKAILAFISSLIIGALITAPLIIPFITIYKSSRIDVLSVWAAPPYTYFTRVIHRAYGLEPYYYYMGVIPLTITLTYFLKVNLRSMDKSVRNFIFFLLSSVFFLWYSSVHYAPISIAHVVRALIPFAISIRVVSRSIILASLSIGACTGIACSNIAKILKRRSNALSRILPVILSFIVFIDLTWGIEPATQPVFNGLESFNYIRNQQEDFNVVGYPPVWSLPHYIAAYINKSILSSNTLFTVYNEQINNQTKLYNRFVRVYSTSYISNGGFEDEINSSNWNIELSGNSRATRTNMKSKDGEFSLYLSMNTSRSMEYIKLSQSIKENPVATKDVYISISVNPSIMINTSLRIGVTLIENVTGEVKRIYIYEGDVLKANQWNNIVRNMSSYIDRGIWQLTNISIEAYSLMGMFEAYIDSIDIYYDEGDVPLKLGYYGVKYVYIHKDREFIDRYVAYGDEKLIEEIYGKVKTLIHRLEDSNSFEKVYSDEKLDIFRNKYFKGFVFPLDNDTYVDYSWIDFNTLKIKVKAKSNTTIIVCQPHHKGWRAVNINGENIEINNFNGVMSLSIKPNTNEVTMHFNEYENSLIRIGLSWTVTLIVVLITCRLKRWKHSSQY